MTIFQVAFGLSFAGAGIIFLWALNRATQAARHKPPHPPGPPSKGIFLGNDADVAVPLLWRVYAEWAKIYGEMTSCDLYVVNVY
jgi:hypothetical protein